MLRAVSWNAATPAAPAEPTPAVTLKRREETATARSEERSRIEALTTIFTLDPPHDDDLAVRPAAALVRRPTHTRTNPVRLRLESAPGRSAPGPADPTAVQPLVNALGLLVEVDELLEKRGVDGAGVRVRRVDGLHLDHGRDVGQS